MARWKLTADAAEQSPTVLAEGRAGRVVACAHGHMNLQIGALTLSLHESALRELASTMRKAVRSLDEQRLRFQFHDLSVDEV